MSQLSSTPQRQRHLVSVRPALLSVACSLLVALGAAPSAWPQTSAPEHPRSPDPRELLARAWEAAGGSAWDDVQALRTEVQATAGGLEGTAVVWEDLRTGRYATTFELGPVAGAAGFDGESVWSRDSSGQVHVTDSLGDREEAVNQAYLRCQAHFYPERWPAEVTFARDETEGERSFHVLTLHPQGGRPFELWLDAETLLVARIVDQGKLDTWTHLFSDYRTVQGLRLPFEQRSTNGRPQFDQVTRLVEVEVNPRIAEGTFAVPESQVTDFEIAGGAAAVTLPFELLNNHIYVQARINGQGPFRFLVDTGGANVLVPEAVAALGLTAEGAFEARGAGAGSEEVGLTRVETLGLGEVRLSDQLFFVLPLADMEAVEGVEFAGLVGFEVFKRFVVTIDYAGRRLTLTRPEAFRYQGPGRVVPFSFDEHVPQVQGEVDGFSGLFTIDTGSRAALTLNAPFVAEHRLAEKYAPRFDALTGWGVGGGVRSHPVRAGLLKLGGVEIREVVADLFVGEAGAFSDRYLAGNVGGGVLKRFTVTFDYGRKEMILEPGATATRPEGYDRAGIWINLAGEAGEAFQVEDVVPGSPAAEAGLAVGDRITAVDGRPVAELSLSEVRQRFKSEAPGTEVHLALVGEDGGSREVTLTLRDLI